MGDLRLSFLGAFQVVGREGETAVFKSDKVRALLAYLAVEADRPHQRQALAGLLWPAWTSSKALANLRFTLYDLRQAIGDYDADPPYLLIDRRRIQFNRASAHWLDVAAFADAARGDAAAWETALSLYKGRFLAGFSLEDAPAFEEWVRLERERWERQYVILLQRLARHSRQQGAYPAAARYLNQQLVVESWNEEAHRRLMEIMALQGRRSAALQQYETCRRQLRRDLDVAPTRQTTALYERLRDAGPGAPGVVEKRPFWGREGEMSRLRQQAAQALTGDGRVFFITGEAGIGKTALLHAFAAWALAAYPELVVAISHCPLPDNGSDPYLPFRELLQLLAGDLDGKYSDDKMEPAYTQRLKDIASLTAQTMAAAAPDLIDLFVPARVLPDAGAAAERGSGAADEAALFSQVTRLVARLAQEKPLLLLLDDWQWADAGSAALLAHLGRRLRQHRVLILVASRPVTGVDRREKQALSVRRQLQRTTPPIDLNAVDRRQFVDALLDGEPNRFDEAFRRRMTQYTGGNALFVLELLHGLRRRGDLKQDEAGYWVTAPDLDWTCLPAGTEAVIAERLARLAPAQRWLLQIASVEGETFTAEVAAQVGGEPAAAVMDQLAGLSDGRFHLIVPHGLHRPGGVGPGLARYRFRHVLLRNHLYHHLDANTRQRWHEAAGAALETLYQGHTAQIAGRLAHHFEAAGVLSKAAAYLLQAGQQANLFSAGAEATARFRRGLRLLQQLPPAPARDRQKLQLYLALSGAMLTNRGWAPAERADILERAYTLATQMDDAPHLLQALAYLAGVNRAQGNYARSLKLGRRMLAMGRDAADPEQLYLAHYVLGETLLFQGAIPAARRHLHAALGQYRLSFHPGATGSRGVNTGVLLLIWLSWSACLLGRPDEAVAYGRRAAALAEEVRHPLSQAFALGMGNVVVCLLRREADQIGPPVARLAALVAEYDLAVMVPWRDLFQGVVRATAGDVAAGIRQARRGMARWAEMGATTGRPLQLLLLAQMYERAGEMAAALQTLEKAVTLTEQVGGMIYQAEALRQKGRLLAMQMDDLDGGEAALRAALALAEEQGALWWALRTAVSLVRLQERRGEETPARAIVADIYSRFTEGFATRDLTAARQLFPPGSDVAC